MLKTVTEEMSLYTEEQLEDMAFSYILGGGCPCRILPFLQSADKNPQRPHHYLSRAHRKTLQRTEKRVNLCPLLPSKHLLCFTGSFYSRSLYSLCRQRKQTPLTACKQKKQMQSPAFFTVFPTKTQAFLQPYSSFKHSLGICVEAFSVSSVFLCFMHRY